MVGLQESGMLFAWRVVCGGIWPRWVGYSHSDAAHFARAHLAHHRSAQVRVCQHVYLQLLRIGQVQSDGQLQRHRLPGGRAVPPDITGAGDRPGEFLFMADVPSRRSLATGSFV